MMGSVNDNVEGDDEREEHDDNDDGSQVFRATSSLLVKPVTIEFCQDTV